MPDELTVYTVFSNGICYPGDLLLLALPKAYAHVAIVIVTR